MIFPQPPPNDIFILDCNSWNICKYSTIYCPLNAECHIKCNDDYSCQDAFIVWTQDPTINSTLYCDENKPHFMNKYEYDIDILNTSNVEIKYRCGLNVDPCHAKM